MPNSRKNLAAPPPINIDFSGIEIAKTAAMLCAAMIFAVSIVLDPNPRVIGAKGYAVAWILLVAGSIVLCVLARQWVRGGSQVKFDRDGLCYPRFSEHLIEWDHIAEVKLIEASGNAQLGIRLEDRARARFPKLRGLWRRFERRPSGFDFSITLSAMTCEPAEVMCLIGVHSGGRL